MTTINKVAVIGSGVMGMGIAAHMANAGIPVVLLDIVPKDAENRNVLAEGAIAKALKTKPAPFSHKRKAKLVTAGNLEDNLDMLADVDWIIEVVIERLDIKQDVYKKIDAVRKKGSIVSSNTSTLPLHELTSGMPDSFCKDFLITHFFNPPRYMRLLELVAGKKTRTALLKQIEEFADIRLGKGCVHCKDTPGFIANRIGVFWLMSGLIDAIELGISVEDADAVMGKPIGVPKTGVFGLFDLIGIDLMPHIAKAMLDYLPKTDAFCEIYREPKLVTKMIADGYTGRKGKGGFYRINKDGGKKTKEAINLTSGDYSKANKSKLDSVSAAREGLHALVTHDDIGGQYAKAVLVKTLAYTASLIPEISDDIIAVDDAMRMGYNWKYGPFELIDRLSTKEQSGAAWLAATLKADGQPVPPILTAVGNGTFYHTEEGLKHYYNPTQKTYDPFLIAKDAWMLHEKIAGHKPLFKNGSAKLWDIGDGVACLEFTSKMNSVDPETLRAINASVEIVKKDFKGLVIGNDGDNFSVGANIGVLLFAANIAAWSTIDDILAQGQQALLGLKYAPFPVVSAVSGMALGGGCEITLHSDAVQAHIESYMGLVEVGVGVVPAWGGCKELLFRGANKPTFTDGMKMMAKTGKMPSMSAMRGGGAMPIIAGAFETISMAKVAESADQAKDIGFLNDKSRITMNRTRVIPDAKALCLELAKDYTPPETQVISLPGESGRDALFMAVDGFVQNGKATAHDEIVSKELAHVLTGGDCDITDELTEQDILDLERKHFLNLVKTEGSRDRIEYMLDNGKPLRN